MRSLIVWISLLLGLPGALGAWQTGTESPHGPLTRPCTTCHVAERWRPAIIPRDFEHAPGRFRLEGAHAAGSCVACHAGLRFSPVARECEACHRDLHRGELGRDCSQCHTTRSFLDGAVQQRAHRESRFPLEGRHLVVECRSCHPSVAQGALQFRGRPTDCFACHAAVYAATTTPPHQAAGFAPICQSCHTPRTWSGARFNHAGTAFPLTGAHIGASCAACHADGVYGGRPSTCVACHQGDYDRTTSPGHAAAGFPTDCVACHATGQWEGARFDHDAPFFPIFSGPHRGTWANCATCHTTPGTFAQFSCLQCHEHSQARMDDKHRERPGYRYDSVSCLQCHPRGTE